MRKHNILFSTAVPQSKQFTKPKQVVTAPITGNLGKGLTREQYQGLLNSIDDLNTTTAVQHKEYDDYVEYNEKATVRSDYNIEDITKLAKSLEKIVDDLWHRWKQQEKWNEYFKQMILNAGDNTNTNILIDDKTSVLQQQIDQLRAQLSSSNDNSQFVELNLKMEDSNKQIQNLLRVLQQIPGLVTDIAAICNKSEGGFSIKYQTVQFKDIDLDAELPNVPDDTPMADNTPDESEGGDVSESTDMPGEDQLDEEIPEEGENAVTKNLTEVELSSPTSMKFSTIYADTSSISDINTALESTKDAVQTVEAVASPLGVVFAGRVTVTNASGSINVTGLFANGGIATASRSDSAKYIIKLSLSFNDHVKVYSVLTTITATANNQYSGRSAGGLASIYAEVVGGDDLATYDQTINFIQFSQANADNDSWKCYDWTTEYGITSFYVTVVGVASTSSSSSGGSSGDITIPQTGTLSTECSTSKVQQDITPKLEEEDQ